MVILSINSPGAISARICRAAAGARNFWRSAAAMRSKTSAQLSVASLSQNSLIVDRGGTVTIRAAMLRLTNNAATNPALSLAAAMSMADIYLQLPYSDLP